MRMSALLVMLVRTGCIPVGKFGKMSVGGSMRWRLSRGKADWAAERTAALGTGTMNQAGGGGVIVSFEGF